MADPSRSRRTPVPSSLSGPQQETLRRTNAAITIQRAVRAHLGRRRQAALDTVGLQAYQQLRVYHGTHEVHAEGILQRGLIPQGGEGLSPMIGHREAQGKVFYTKDKQQAAYYARTVSGMEQVHRVIAARQAKDPDLEYEERHIERRPTILRALLAPSVQQQAKHDDKGADQDFTLARSVPASLMLPGHLEPDADLAQRQSAVTLFRAAMNVRGANATPVEAARTLTRMRSNSISRDQEALESTYAKESAERNLTIYKYMKGVS